MVDETLRTLPLLFSVCSTAQAAAAVRACEQAMGITHDNKSEQAREQLVLLEAIREHLWQPLFRWNTLLNQTADEITMATVMSIQQQSRQRLSASLFQPAATTTVADLSAQQQQLKGVLQQQLFGMDLESWLTLETPEQLTEWSQSRTTIATQFIHQLQQRGWSAVGQCPIEPLPELQRETLENLLHNSHFIEHPNWNDSPHENSALTQSDSPLLRQLHHEFGNGLLTRSIARLTGIASLTLQLEQPATSVIKPAITTGAGIGSAKAARGLLLHRVEIEQQQIRRYQILAPTEWNFHPRGVVACALSTLSCKSVDLEQQARHLIHAIDPCVGYDLVINH